MRLELLHVTINKEMNFMRVTYLEILHMKCRGDDLSVVSPLLTFEAQEAVAFELLHKRVSLIFLIEFRLRSEHFSDEIGVGDGETNCWSEPHKK